MRGRSLIPFVLAGLVLAGCGSSAGPGAAVLPAAVPPPTTSAPGGVASTSGPTAPPATEARPTAPDFSLPLGDGGTFLLSEEARPVYLVFWAEW